MSGFEGFTKIYSSGTYKNRNYIIIDRLGPTLKELYKYCNNHFSLQTILLIGIQILSRLQDLNFKSGYIHNDIKPNNFCIGTTNTNLIYMIDFSLAKPFRYLNYSNSKMEHIQYKENLKPDNCHKFSSINHLMGIETSRRDDLESLGYMLIYFINNGLPWQGGSKTNKQEKQRKMLNKKLSIPVEVYSKDLPIEFSIYMNYIFSLRFDEKPDYIYLKGLFADLLFSFYIEKFYFDWTLENPKEIPINLRVNKELDNKYIVPTKIEEENKYILKDDSSKIDISNIENKDFGESKEIKEESSSDEHSQKESQIKEKVMNFLKMQTQQLIGQSINNNLLSINNNKNNVDKSISEKSEKDSVKSDNESNSEKNESKKSKSVSSYISSVKEESDEEIMTIKNQSEKKDKESCSDTASFKSKESNEEEENNDLDIIYNEIKEAPKKVIEYKKAEIININNKVIATPSFGADSSKIQIHNQNNNSNYGNTLKIGVKSSYFNQNISNTNSKADLLVKSSGSKFFTGSVASDTSSNMLYKPQKNVKKTPNFGKLIITSDKYNKEED